ncbi:hypothetical protein BCV70DRAFT_88381 [Testicularia cyperi]|uniref:Uncharacterized protein n=1 Tax=Testicularia cyperi TaxID=1882483 RepID=A0A317XRT3_9BASI|nr:hypothetical protein BCV70DRAFT_88381 [Testicularia cyperi]
MPLGFGHHSQKDPSIATEERGRDPFIATGRGGAGNIIRSPSRSRDRSGNAMPAAVAVPPHVTHSGRGGAGNVRSPSRDPLDRKRAEEAQAKENKLQEEYRQHDLKGPHSTGRGGAGNIASDSTEERGRGRDGGSGGVSGSRPRASESSKLAQVEENSRSSEEESAYAASTVNGDTNGHKPGFKEKIASHLPGNRRD